MEDQPLPYPDDRAIDGRSREILENYPRNLFRYLAAAKGALPGFVEMAQAIRHAFDTDPILREMAILRIGHATKATYETHHHEAIARTIGMTEEQLRVARTGNLEGTSLSERERAVLVFANEIVQGPGIGDATRDRMIRLFGERQFIELCVATSYYLMVCRLIRCFGVEIERDAIDYADLTHRLPVVGAEE